MQLAGLRSVLVAARKAHLGLLACGRSPDAATLQRQWAEELVKGVHLES